MAAKENKENALPEGQAEKPKEGSRFKRIIIILAILFMTLALSGGGAYWFLYLRTPEIDKNQQTEQTDTQVEKKEEADKKDPAKADLNSARIERQSDLPRSSGIVTPLPSITVNLTDPGGRRYLKLGLEVELNADVTDQLKNQEPRIRDAIIMILAGRSYADIATPDGKILLKAEIAARLNQILGVQRVIRVYFTDFVVE